MGFVDVMQWLAIAGIFIWCGLQSVVNILLRDQLRIVHERITVLRTSLQLGNITRQAASVQEALRDDR